MAIPLDLIFWATLIVSVPLLLRQSLQWYANSPPFRKRIFQQDQRNRVQFPDPDPLLEFDLANATARNHVYMNKPLRYPYFQVRTRLPVIQ